MKREREKKKMISPSKIKKYIPPTLVEKEGEKEERKKKKKYSKTPFSCSCRTYLRNDSLCIILHINFNQNTQSTNFVLLQTLPLIKMKLLYITYKTNFILKEID